MGNVYKSVDQGMRLGAEYSEAKMLFEERRLAQARVAEIDRTLRDMSEEHPEAVQVACWDIPFRKLHGRQKSAEKTIKAGAPTAAPLINRPDFTA